MKNENFMLAHQLSKLTSGLIAPSAEYEERLNSIRRIVAYNLINNKQQFSKITNREDDLGIEIPKEKLQQIETITKDGLLDKDQIYFKKVGRKSQAPIVHRRTGDSLLPFDIFSKGDEFRWNQRREDLIGPFLSEEGLSTWFDLYHYTDKLTVRSQRDQQAHFLFSAATKQIWSSKLERGSSIVLKQGHIWIRAGLFSSAVDSNEYVGFVIRGGTFKIDNNFDWSGQFLDFENQFTGQLELRLQQPDANSPNFDGCSAAQKIKFKYPEKIVLNWKLGKLVSIQSTEGAFIGFGNECVFGPPDKRLQISTELNHILITYPVQPTSWKGDSNLSDLLQVEGELPIKKAAFALPLVRVTNPDTLSEPQNNGGWFLQLSKYFEGRWIGSDAQQPEALLQRPIVFLYPNALALYSKSTNIAARGNDLIEQEFLCWQLDANRAARIPFHLSYKGTFQLAYYCHAEEGSSLFIEGNGSTKNDRPRYADGSLMQIKDAKGWVVFSRKGGKFKITTILDNRASLDRQFKLLALENALLVSSLPYALILEGELEGSNHNHIGKGKMSLLTGVLRWKPTLPDPYISNLQKGWIRGGDLSKENHLIAIKNKYTAYSLAKIEWEEISKPMVHFQSRLPLEAGVGIQSQSEPKISGLPKKVDKEELKNIKKYQINAEKKKVKETLERPFDQIESMLNGWKLLDVSTNQDLIGVSISPGLYRNTKQGFSRGGNFVVTDHNGEVDNPNNSELATAFVIKDMAVHTPLRNTHVFMLPQVQWEPVQTLEEDQDVAALGWFPENLSSADDGGPTRIISTGERLSPVVPKIVADEIQSNFEAGAPAAVLTTLSFGLKAVLGLSPVDSASRHADSMEQVQPSFEERQLRGGRQIKLLAESGSPVKTERSPGFPGFTTQTLNGYELLTGTPLGLSVLGATVQSPASVESQFNDEFSVSGTEPFVPVTRFDLSGYGASNFSDWDNPGALAQIGKVQFKIMVGRTAMEIVKFVSKIYPWGITVTRSVTIERRSSGGVVRKDSGWQAAPEGIFDFRNGNNPQPYIFRPGLLRGINNAQNIRPVSDDILSFQDPNDASVTVKLAPVYFDCDVIIDGQQDSNVTSKGALGFIQLLPKGDTLSVAAFQALIQEQGAIGGPIDAMLDVGGSGFSFGASRFELDVVNNAGSTEFAGVVRGQPQLPGNGAWSVVKIASSTNLSDNQEAISADANKGTPLFIENSWQIPNGSGMNVSPSIGAYRFVDANDLFRIDPNFDYGFMQNSGSQAFLYRRPEIQPGDNFIKTSVPPAFADPFALLSSKGVFPPVANAIEFPNANAKLIITAAGNKLRLDQPINIVNPRPTLVVARDGTDQITIEYDQSQFYYELKNDSWKVDLDDFYIWTSLFNIDKFSGVRYSLKAANNSVAKLVNVQSLLKQEIQDALNFLPGMGQPNNVPDILLGMTNAKHEVKVHTSFKKEIKLGKKVKLKLKGSAGVDSIYDTKSTVGWEAFFGASVGAGLQGKIPIGGIFFMVLGLDLEVGLRAKSSPTSTSSPTTDVGFKYLDIAAYIGVGVGGFIGPFEASAYLAVGVVFVYEDNKAKLGGLVRLEGNIDLKIVTVNLLAELRGVVYKGDDPATPAIETDVNLCDAKGKVAVNVSILFVISIKASYAYKTTQKL